MFKRMFGRSGTGLLAMIVLILAPALVRGQSERVDAATAVPVPGFSVPPIGVDRPLPSPVLPRLPTSSPGTLSRPVGLPVLSRAAGTIFSGTVTSIVRRAAAQPGTIETVALTFHVENAIRGATVGEKLTISQWIGLWSGGQRYHVGERVLLFLYPPSKLGLTSCVGGALGHFTIDPRGWVLLSAQHLSAFRADPVLGGKSHVSFGGFAEAVQRAMDSSER
jgi:hypothetical protein